MADLDASCPIFTIIQRVHALTHNAVDCIAFKMSFQAVRWASFIDKSKGNEDNAQVGRHEFPGANSMRSTAARLIHPVKRI
jgi:hypothetical protein